MSGLQFKYFAAWASQLVNKSIVHSDNRKTAKGFAVFTVAILCHFYKYLNKHAGFSFDFQNDHQLIAFIQNFILQIP